MSSCKLETFMMLKCDFIMAVLFIDLLRAALANPWFVYQFASFVFIFMLGEGAVSCTLILDDESRPLGTFFIWNEGTWRIDVMGALKKFFINPGNAKSVFFNSDLEMFVKCVQCASNFGLPIPFQKWDKSNATCLLTKSNWNACG